MAKRVVETEAPDFSLPLDEQSLGRFVRARRTQQRIDLQTAALLCDVSVNTLQAIENGSGGTRLSSLFKVCGALGVRLRVEPWEHTGDGEDV
jgi:transcriptional regulator with XRE-family HTH domain